MKNNYRSNVILISAFIMMFALVLLYIFARPLFTQDALYSLDAAPFYQKLSAWTIWQSFSGTWYNYVLGQSGSTVFSPMRMFVMMMPPLLSHVIRYMFDTVLLFASTIFYLRIRGFNWRFVCLPALAFSLSGYLFTLISAGHIFTFDLVPWMMFMFVFVELALQKGRLYHFVMIGVCAGIGFFSRMPDLMALFAVLAGIHGIYRLFCLWPEIGWQKFLAKRIFGALIAGIVFILLSLQTLSWMQGGVVASREKMQGSTTADRWEYVTNWSLPPKEIVEFIAPAVFGHETVPPERMGCSSIPGFVPYWGELGSPIDWQKNVDLIKHELKTQGDPKVRASLEKQLMMLFQRRNYRQHNLYLGVVPIVFFIYALIWSFRRKRERVYLIEAGVDDEAMHQKQEWRREIWFWSIVAFVCLLLAFGRYFPLYRLYFYIPVFNKMRCPVKFVHLVEIALCMLFAFGLSAFVSELKMRCSHLGSNVDKCVHTKHLLSKDKMLSFVPTYTIMMFLSLTAALLLGGVALYYQFNQEGLNVFLQGIGRGNQSSLLLKGLTKGLYHGALLFSICAVVFAVPCFFPRSIRRWQTLSLVILFVVVSFDLAVTDKKYVRTKDMTGWYGKNPVAEMILQEQPARVAYFLGPMSKRNWLFGSFFRHTIDFCFPNNNDAAILSDKYRKYYAALGHNQLKMWQILGSKYILGNTKSMSQLINHPMFRVKQYFSSAGGRITLSSRPSEHVLLEMRDCLPKALVFYDWSVLSSNQVLEKMSSRDWNPNAQLLVSDSSDLKAQHSKGTSPVDVEKYDNDYVLLKTSVEKPGVLLLNDAFDSDWQVRVDGERRTLLLCNYLMRGVKLEKGDHNIEFRYVAPLAQRWRFRIILLVLGAVALWGAILLLISRRKKNGALKGENQ